ncbi:MAG TPA: hypothetical protein VHL34_21415 [Rhizomicrobium sp.]|jgi:flagellar biosynthesis/type III secretory pathway protein FliH|nr:hypothetical protein [Rhizomicrobium sp.]
MSAIIKSDAVAAQPLIRPIAKFAPARTSTVSPVETELAALRRQVAQLESQLADRGARISTLQADLPRAREQGFAEGKERGLAAAVDREAERLAALKQGIAAALAALEQRLDRVSALAPVLVKECLDQLFAETDNRTQIVSDLIAKQMVRIAEASLVAVEVSSSDYSDGALDALAEALGMPRTILCTSDDLQSGQCFLRLKLGHLDVSLDQQWGVLRAILDEGAAPR